MAHLGWLKVGQRLLLILGIFLFAGLGNSAGATPLLLDPAARQARTECAIQLGIRGKFDPLDGVETIAALNTMNAILEARIASGDLTAAQVFTERLAFISTNLVTAKNGQKVPVVDKNGQKVPYVELRLPHAYTGVYLPTGNNDEPMDAAGFDGALIALPGIGFSVSVAKSMMEIGGTFKKGKSEWLALSPNRKLRLMPFPMDPPLNGMGESAPYGLGHPDGVMAVLHHARLILGALYPGKKFFMIGRSQGGLNALEYAARYTDVERVVALNPSSPDEYIHQHCIIKHEEMALPENIDAARAQGFDCTFHAKSWTAHADFTPLYTILRRPTLVPAFIQLGDEDTSYPQPYFLDHWKGFAAAQNDRRQVQVYKGGHNLWTKMGRNREKAEWLFDQTTRDITKFFAPSIIP